jgi:3-phenylpropionate/cinnamic acid dioxygenase small subunit
VSTTAPARPAGAEVKALLSEYVRCLDELRIADWEGFFAEEAHYEVSARENVERGLPLSHVLDHTRARIRDRVTYILEVWDGHYNAYWPRHILGEPILTGVDGADSRVETPFALYITEAGSVGSRLLAVGRYQDTVTLEGGVPRFRRKRVILDTTVLPRYFVYPI